MKRTESFRSRPQATKCTQRQIAYLAYWQARGYQFAWNESAPETTVKAPGIMNRIRTAMRKVMK